MSIYDQLLGVVQHGYDQANQNQMAVANMPTFADKFLAGLRGGEEQAYKQQMGMAQFGMNRDWKQAQEQNMQNQRVQQLLGGLEKTTIQGPEQRQALITALTRLGRTPEEAESLIPQLGPTGTWSGSEASHKLAQDAHYAKLDQANQIKVQADSEYKKLQGQLAAAKTSTEKEMLQYKVAEAKAKSENADAYWKSVVFKNYQQQPFASPIPAVSNVTGEPVLLQPKKTGGVEEIEGYTPQPKAGTAKKAVDPAKMQAAIDEAKQWIPKSSSGAVETYTTQGISRGLGISSDSSQANTRLKTISGWMTSNVPRMEGPQSDKDVQIYQEMAAKVGDTTYPIDDRLAALSTLQTLMDKYKNLNVIQAPAPKPGGKTKVETKINPANGKTYYKWPDGKFHSTPPQ